jgi:heme-degrading monooxygenase HmoA
MYARIVQSTAATDIDGGVAFVRDTVVPIIRQQHGYRGLVVSADRAARVFGVLSLWTDKADLEASTSALAKTRDEGQKIIGGELTVEGFEEILFEAKQPPGPGTALLVRHVSMDSAKVDDNIEFFRSTILPQIQATPGFRGVRQMVNRETGSSVVGTLWDDAAAMEKAAAEAEARQAQAAGRVTFGEQTKREILFVDVP